MRSYVAIKHFLYDLLWTFVTGAAVLLMFAALVGGFVHVWQKHLGTVVLGG